MVYVQASELFPKKTLASGQCQVSRCAIIIEGFEIVCFPSALKVLRIHDGEHSFRVITLQTWVSAMSCISVSAENKQEAYQRF